MAVYSGTYALYEKLASAKMNAMVAAINSHTHDGTYGVQVNFTNVAGTIAASQIPASVISGTMLAASSVTTSHIVNGTIQIDDVNTSSVHLSADGYCTYAP